MKHLKTNVSVAALLAASLLWTGCQKEVSNTSPEIQTSQSTARLGGAVADDPAIVSIVPMVMSVGATGNSSNAGNAVISALGRGVKGGGGTTDVTAPVVSITSPTNGATVSGSVSVAVTATDNVGVASVSLSVDGTVKATLTTAPYNFTWDASTVADGTHTLTATAKDAKGNTGTSTITVSKSTPIVIINPGPLPSNYMMATPPVGNQGNEFACTPFAVVYSARSIEQYYRTNASSFSYSSNIFSPEYIYDQVKAGTDCGSGASITACLNFMYNYGVTTWQTVPFSDVNGCSITPTASQISEAANYKIPNYTKMLSTDTAMIKTMVVGKHPVMVPLNIDNNFTNATAGYIWNTIGSGQAPHTVIVCGYDNAKNAFRVQNSWGTSWGDAGYLWIDYGVFMTRAGYYSYAMNY